MRRLFIGDYVRAPPIDKRYIPERFRARVCRYDNDYGKVARLIASQ